jgi:long-chain acyl-CoA synthetase
MAANLLAKGIRNGDRVALRFHNVPEFALAYVGCFKAGAIAVPINHRLRAPEIQYILQHSSAVCYLGSADLYCEAAGFLRELPGIRIRLVDSQDREVPPGEVGEVCAQGGNCFTGYWQDPEATAAAMRNGWLHLGDLARRDADGYYWFAGRSKQIIIRGGSNVSPQEVEAVLMEHPHVSEAAVIGRPDPIWGEVVVGYVVRRRGYQLLPKELIDFARPRIAAYKLPEEIIIIDNLPKTATGKLDRRALRETDQSR